MPIEVEQKFRVSDLSKIAASLDQLGTPIEPVREERDVYFAHPSRDFAATDEALRIRRSGERGFITYKGPKLDATTKTRREIDLPLGGTSGDVIRWHALIEALGFRPVAEVCKQRCKAFVPWLGRSVEVSLDTVDGVGTYVELELITTEEDMDAARKCLASLAAKLGLVENERRSYLELLLRAKGE
jgi:adenylate cyclase class 2